MTRVADPYVGGVTGLPDLVVFPNVEQLRVERSLIQMEHEFRNGGADEAYIHWKTCESAGGILDHRSINRTHEDCIERIHSIESSANSNLTVATS